jgi:hypothetical protein
MEKGTNTDPINIINQNDTYVGMLSTNKSLEVTNDECSSTEIKTQIEGCLIIIQITRVIMTNDKINMNINNILHTFRRTTIPNRVGMKSTPCLEA